MFIKTTDNRLVNLDAIAGIYIDSFCIIAKGRDVVHDGVNRPYTRTYTLGVYHNAIQAINAMLELEESIAAQSPLHIMQAPDPDTLRWRNSDGAAGQAMSVSDTPPDP